MWLSLVERYVRDVEAAGSNPVTPIKGAGVLSHKSSGIFCFWRLGYGDKMALYHK